MGWLARLRARTERTAPPSRENPTPQDARGLHPLQDAYRAWSTKPFPELEGDGAELDELYERLVDVDSYAAGLVSRVAHGSELWPASLEHDEELRSALETHAAGADPVVARDATRLLTHLDELDALIDQATEMHTRARLKRERGS